MSREYVLQSFRGSVDLQIDYAAELNEQQHQAVTARPGPALVIAGAGSGKTRTLTYRVAFLIEQGIPPDRILLLTFTNKAAREMMRRVADLLGTQLNSLWGGTFHSVGARLLRRHANLIGYRPDFTILDREDTQTLIKACVAASEVDIKETRFPKPEVLANLFSMAANRRTEVAEELGDYSERFELLATQIEQVHRLYKERKKSANVMDFDDLLVKWFELLRSDESLREHYQKRFQFVLVDEYQDTNRLQSDLIDLMAARSGNVMVVGDDSQSIYSWRGANFRNILDFPTRYPEARTYKIEVNYRSTPEILSLANAAIRANIHQFSKKLVPARPSGSRPALVECANSDQQALFVAQRMLELRDEGVDLKDMAVLYRSHFHALELQLTLTRCNIPFSITSGIRFFEQAHIKDVVAYLKLVANPRDELAFKRLVQMLPGIGGKSADKLWTAFAAALPKPAADEDPVPVAPALQACSDRVPKKAAVAWAALAATLSQIESAEVRKQPSGMIQLILDAGYDEYLEETYSNFRNRMDDVRQLASFALQFPDLVEFLSQLSLLTNLDTENDRDRDRGREPDDEKVRLSTIHQAKGLEFDVVFVIMLCDGLFPSSRAIESGDGDEEERRLFYVAVTRARKELYLSYPKIRTTPGMGETFQVASRFLTEIPNDLTENWELSQPDTFF